MRVAFFEDERAANFSPIALLRPVFELLCGHFSTRERALRFLEVTEWAAFCRDCLGEAYREAHPEARVNELEWLGRGSTLLLNGRWHCDAPDLLRCERDAAGIINGEVACLWVEPDEVPLFSAADWDTAVAQLARTRRRIKASGRLVNYPWDLIHHNPQQLAWDFAARDQSGGGDTRPLTILGDPADVFVHPSAQIDPFVVFDARKGPIYIDAGVVVQAFTRLEGPCFVGRETQLFRTNLREGCTLGPVCRVGGEVEGCILQGYVNKYHDGFLGHAYVGSWSNLGALTTNSDLKNDYSSVKVPLAGQVIDTGQPKVGCFIGDHTKTAIGAAFNTGTSVGVMCQVLPAGELPPKHIPSFTRVWHGAIDDGLSIEQGLATARIAMNRRGIELSDAQERLLRAVHQQTASEREVVLRKAASPRIVPVA